MCLFHLLSSSKSCSPSWCWEQKIFPSLFCLRLLLLFPVIPPLQSVSFTSRFPSDFSNFLTLSLIFSFHVVTPSKRGKNEKKKKTTQEGPAFPWLAAMLWLVTIQQAQSHENRGKIDIDAAFLCFKSTDY